MSNLVASPMGTAPDKPSAKSGAAQTKPRRAKASHKCSMSSADSESEAAWFTNKQKKVHILLMAEILHPLIGRLSHYFRGFIHPRWCRLSAINSSFNVHNPGLEDRMIISCERVKATSRKSKSSSTFEIMN